MVKQYSQQITQTQLQREHKQGNNLEREPKPTEQSVHKDNKEKDK